MIQYKTENVTVFESQLVKTTSTVIETDDCILVVDPTWLPNEIEEIRLHVNRMKENKHVYLVFTHSDWDHIIGYGAFPEASIIASEGLKVKKEKEKESILEQIREFDDLYYIDRKYPVSYPKVDIDIKEEGQVVRVGNTTLTFYTANGHTDDGVFMIVEPLGIWLAGDYLSDIEFPYIYFNSKEYEETIQKTDEILMNHDIRLLVPGHGHVTESKDEINKRKEDSLLYIKELRKALKSNSDSSHLVQNYSYLKGMRKYHQENIALIEKEKKNYTI